MVLYGIAILYIPSLYWFKTKGNKDNIVIIKYIICSKIIRANSSKNFILNYEIFRKILLTLLTTIISGIEKNEI